VSTQYGYRVFVIHLPWWLIAVMIVAAILTGIIFIAKRNEWLKVEILVDLVGHSCRDYCVALDKISFVPKLGQYQKSLPGLR
jgi:uncharacterized membrane protein